ncbi:MAG TPA: DUF4783 domain-containing protein [Draconibacterium sp.]|nr:DUF4783 domain-containing protein [Draconibacterium sp.]
MKKLIQIFSIILMLCGTITVSAITLQEEKIPQEIVTGFNTGDAKMLSSYFNQNVEMVVLENDNVYSKAQAQQIVANFFSKFPPKENSFSTLHDGEKADSRYVIGKLKTEKGEFRVYFLLKKSGEKDYIHQLRIEQQ